MKKRLLFVIPGLEMGGAEKSLVSLLSALNYDVFSADVFAFDPTGPLASQLPEQVTLLKLPRSYEVAKLPLLRSVTRYVAHAKISAAYHRILYTLTLRRFGVGDRAEQYAWKHYAKLLPVITDEYHAAIGYLEKSANYFVADNTRAARKIAYVHTDYEKLDVDTAFDADCFSKMKHVVVVSEHCAQSLAHRLPSVAGKIRVIENIVSKRELRRLAAEPIEESLDFDGTVLLTVGRLSYEKGPDLALDACEALIVDGMPVKWYHIGVGDMQDDLLAAARNKGLEDAFVLLGARVNPYPYMARCDMYVQPSRYEGKAIAVEEAKLLGKPVIATAYDSVANQIENGVTGFVCAQNAGALAKTIAMLIAQKSVLAEVRKTLSALKDNQEEVLKFYELFGAAVPGREKD